MCATVLPRLGLHCASLSLLSWHQGACVVTTTVSVHPCIVPLCVTSSDNSFSQPNCRGVSCPSTSLHFFFSLHFVSSSPAMSSSPVASEWLIATIPSGHPDPATTFRLQPISSPPTAAPAGHVLLQVKVVSVDPYIRYSLRTQTVGAPQYSYCVAEVLDSQLDGYSKGDMVTGALPWKSVQLHDAKLRPGKRSGQGAALRKVPVLPGVPLTAWVGVLGMVGRTAYFGVSEPELGNIQAGQTVVVSGAAGAVGSLVGQLARMKGAKTVVGIAGGPDKCRLVTEKYGFDARLDYKALDSVETLQAALKPLVPDGIHLYFDNVGGVVSQAMWELYARKGRMVVCGSISSYNKEPKDDLIPNPLSVPILHTVTVLTNSPIAE